MKKLDFGRIIEFLMIVAVAIAFVVAIVFYFVPEKQTTHYYQNGIECTRDYNL